MQDLQGRLAEVGAIAVRLEKKTGCPAQELIAQWAVESQWGGHPAGQHNYFGIKRAHRHAKWCTVTTHEVVAGKTIVVDLDFADYDSLEASCEDFAWLITQGDPYRTAWRGYLADRDLDKLIAGVAHVYATSPNYTRLVTAIAHQSNVTAAIEKAKATA